MLNAEQELLNSQVALVTAKRDAYVAGFQLLNAMGQAEAQDLGLDGGPLYDPLGNYRRVANNWNDWASDPRTSDGRDAHGQPAGDAGEPDRHAADRSGAHRPVAARCRLRADDRAAAATRRAGDFGRANKRYRALMQSPGREPSMEDILASIKKVIAEEKELRTSARAGRSGRGRAASRRDVRAEDDVLELDEPLAPAGRPWPAAGRRRCRRAEPPGARAARRPSPRPFPPPPQVNPLEEMVREMLRPILKQWLDEHLPQMVDEHVKREISRITGRPL